MELKKNTSFSNEFLKKSIEWYHMARLRNTFTRKVYRGISNYNGYYNQGVFNFFLFPIPDTSVPSTIKSAPFVWSSLYKYDNTSLSTGNKDLYDILLSHYQYQIDINDFDNKWNDGIHISGFADFIAAYYDKNGLSISSCKVQSPKLVLNQKKKSNTSMDDNENSAIRIKVYPNPTTNTLSISGVNNNFSVKLFSNNGLLVLNSNNLKVIDISHLTAGMYFVEIIDLNNQLLFREKILKKN